MNSGIEVEILFDFIASLAVAVIFVISQTYQEDLKLSLLFLIPIFLMKIMYTRNNNNKMGAQVVTLRKTFSEEHSTRITLIILILFIIFIVSLNQFLTDSHRIGLPWLLLMALGFLERSITEKFLQKGLMDNGICTGSHLIEWNSVESYKWVNPRKKKDYSFLELGYKSRLGFHKKTLLSVLDDQKKEVDVLFKKMTSV